MNRKYMICYLAVVAMLSGLAMLVMARMLLPVCHSCPFWLIPLFFALMPALETASRKLMSKHSDAATMSVLAYRGCKLLLSLLLLTVCLALMDESRLQFAVTFFAFYIVTTVVETVHMVKRERK